MYATTVSTLIRALTRSRALVVALPVLLALACGGESSVPAPVDGASEALYRWLVLGPEGEAIARAVTDSSVACPDIRVDGSALPMTPRSATAPPGFEAIQVCEHTVPSSSGSVSIGGQALPLPVPSPARIAVIGDTGCRVKRSDVQNCSGPDSLGPVWNFAEVSTTVRDQQPDLIVHVGDYHYREDGTCGERCDQGTIGYTWVSWDADFFTPARDLLPQAPWVVVRGNHEDCGTDRASARSWLGWFYLLDPRPLPTDPWSWESCQSYTDPYRVPVGDMDIVIMDTSEIPDDYSTPDPVTVARYAAEFSAIDGLVDDQRPAWLATHRPFWAVSSFVSGGEPQLAVTDSTLQMAIAASDARRIPGPIKALIAGHVHLFEFLTFTDGRPPQIVFGGGGTELSPAITDALLGANPGILSALAVDRQNFTSIHGVDFGIIEPVDAGWLITVKSAVGVDQDAFTVSAN